MCFVLFIYILCSLIKMDAFKQTYGSSLKLCDGAYHLDYRGLLLVGKGTTRKWLHGDEV